MLPSENPWKFSCEFKSEIPLPPEYTFPQAFNYFNEKTNSFYILESPEGSYIQCGGSKARCMVEMRIYMKSAFMHFVLGKAGGGDGLAEIQMSNGVNQVRENEVFTHWEAIELFKKYYADEDFGDNITQREVKF